jgi:hypothetical protein
LDTVLPDEECRRMPEAPREKTFALNELELPVTVLVVVLAR